MKTLALLLLVLGAAVCLAQAQQDGKLSYDKFNEVLKFFGPDFPCYMCEQIASLQSDHLCPHLEEAGLSGHCKQIAHDYELVKDSKTPREFCSQLNVCQ